MKPLNVPLVIQAKGSVDCGLATSNMITAYWKLPMTLADVRKHLKVDKLGTYCPQLGSFFIKQGFAVEIIHFNPGLFTLKDTGKSKKEIEQHLKLMLKKKRKQGDKKVIRYFLKFLKDGGELEVKIPTADDIRKELEHKRPLIAVLTSSFLFAKTPRFNFHFNVVTGIDDEYVYVNDPAWDDRGGKHKYKISDFMFGMYASAEPSISLDNPSLIKIGKK